MTTDRSEVASRLWAAFRRDAHASRTHDGAERSAVVLRVVC